MRIPAICGYAVAAVFCIAVALTIPTHEAVVAVAVMVGCALAFIGSCCIAIAVLATIRKIIVTIKHWGK